MIRKCSACHKVTRDLSAHLSVCKRTQPPGACGGCFKPLFFGKANRFVYESTHRVGCAEWQRLTKAGAKV